jgi:hypothetical protein
MIMITVMPSITQSSPVSVHVILKVMYFVVVLAGFVPIAFANFVLTSLS